MHNTFERAIEVAAAEFEGIRYGFPSAPWAEFLLNPRRLRGSDFLMRWSQGVWSEQRIVHAVNETSRYHAIPYGPSGVAPSGNPRQHELYFERLDHANLGGLKRPDLLVVREQDHEKAEAIIHSLGGLQELPFVDETQLRSLLDLAVLALECENSLWKAARMPAYGQALRPQRRTGRLGMPRSAVLPTIILKEEDRAPLLDWQASRGVPIHIWHLFFDLAFGISLESAEGLIASGEVEPTRQVFQAPGGASTSKVIYKIYYQLAYPVGVAESEPRLLPESIEDKNGHILPYVRFEGGALKLSPRAMGVLESLSEPS